VDQNVPNVIRRFLDDGPVNMTCNICRSAGFIYREHGAAKGYGYGKNQTRHIRFLWLYTLLVMGSIRLFAMRGGEGYPMNNAPGMPRSKVTSRTEFLWANATR
jgi:hypothetical protein